MLQISYKNSDRKRFLAIEMLNFNNELYNTRDFFPKFIRITNLKSIDYEKFSTSNSFWHYY